MNDFPIEPQSYKVHVDASLDHQKPFGRIAWVVYLQNELISTNILPKIRTKSAQRLEELVFKIINQIYEGAKIYTDSANVWEEWKGKNKNRIYLIDRKDNLADDLLRGKDIPIQYKKVPTFKFEYVKVLEQIDGAKIDVIKNQKISNKLKQKIIEYESHNNYEECHDSDSICLCCSVLVLKEILGENS